MGTFSLWVTEKINLSGSNKQPHQHVLWASELQSAPRAVKVKECWGKQTQNSSDPEPAPLSGSRSFLLVWGTPAAATPTEIRRWIGDKGKFSLSVTVAQFHPNLSPWSLLRVCFSASCRHLVLWHPAGSSVFTPRRRQLRLAVPNCSVNTQMW